MPVQVDQRVEEPKEEEQGEQTGTLTDWIAVAGEWVPSTYGSFGGVWECPSLFPLPVDGDAANKKWVLMVSVQDGAAGGGSGIQYFVGDFDGQRFESDNPPENVLWADYGADFYAGVEWNNFEGENGEKYWLGWMSNWQYADRTPTTSWRSSMSLPRKIELTETEDGLRLKQTPISLASIRTKQDKIMAKDRVISGKRSRSLPESPGSSYELIAEFDLSDATASEFGFKIRKGNLKNDNKDEQTVVGYDVGKQKLFVDRTKSGNFNFGRNVKGKHEAPMRSINDTVKIHLFVDRSSVEVFGNDGIGVITDQVFPLPSSDGLEFYSKGGKVTLKSFELYPIKTIWGKSPVQTKVNRWKKINGSWADTWAGKQGQSERDAFILSEETGSDFTYEAEIKVLDTDSHPLDPDQDTVNNPIGAGALVFRSDALANNAYIANIDVLNNVVKLVKFVDGKPTDLAVYDGVDLETNTNYHLKAVTENDSIQIYLDDELVIDTNDDTFTDGYFGLNVWNSTSVFNQIKYKNKTNFHTNFSGWAVATEDDWERTLDGITGSTTEQSAILSSNKDENFHYQATITFDKRYGNCLGTSIRNKFSP
ncbi:glycoside hydrolase family 32 protein [Brevibacillus formosus]